MPAVYPFAAVQFKNGQGDVSSLVSPPYDVLDARSKQALLQKDQHNVVAIDLPHTPAKELGPQAEYDAAGETYRSWLREGVLSRRATPAMFAYRQSFKDEATGRSFQRSGMACTVEAVPFGPRAGGGILPHEETFSGPKEDRFALMKAARAQLSPIFGLFADEQGLATALLHRIMASRAPDQTATTPDSVKHEVWAVEDAATIKAYQDALAGQDVFIADGHHRYTTGLNYLKHLESQGPVPPEHPARRSMMVLVGMSDPGLVIWPTHRVLGGMREYTFERFAQAAAGMVRLQPVEGGLDGVSRALDAAPAGENWLGLYDFESKSAALATPSEPDPLRTRFASKPPAWRTLDVALVQYVLVEQICQPLLNGGEPVKWAFPHTIKEVLEIGLGAETGAGGGAGFKAQLAVIVRPTPLDAVRAVSAAGELMPQKSTFFYPKLATGLWINPLE